MKTIKIWDIPSKIKRLCFDGDKKDLRLHLDSSYSWGSPSKRTYNKVAKMIDKLTVKGNGWLIYSWYDISGFEYWMKGQEEFNYIQISISFDNEDINEDEIINIDAALTGIEDMAEDISLSYDFIEPSIY